MLESITQDEQKVLLQNLIAELAANPKTNSWEKEFLASVSQQLIYRDLSEKQIAVINKMKQKCEIKV